MAPLESHMEAKDREAAASGSEMTVDKVPEKSPSSSTSSPPSGENDAAPIEAGDDTVRTIHGLKVGPASADTLASNSGIRTDRSPIPVVLCL